MEGDVGDTGKITGSQTKTLDFTRFVPGYYKRLQISWKETKKSIGDDDDDDGFIGAFYTQGFLRQVKGAIELGARNDPGVVSYISIYRCWDCHKTDD